MKNKKLLLTLIISVAVVVIATATTLLICFTGLNACERNIKNSMQAVHSISAVVTVRDGETEVYAYERSVQIEGENTVVTVCESKLNSSFVLERQTPVQTQQKTDRQKLFGLNLKSELLSNVSFKNSKLTAKISEQNLPKVFAGASASGEAELTAIFESKHITQLTCSYLSTAGHTVTLTVTYTY